MFIFIGCAIGAGYKFTIEKYLLKDTSDLHAPKQGYKVEPLYTFDIHCNSFVPVFLITFAAQSLLIPLIINSDDITSKGLI
mmetsp:Transcript_11427/g.7950  ORF Transcript_11427/g.7950 Transcript_11427/m.7950 type:complete len:81 (+) Transcript_11427:380-622(+)